MNSNITLRSNIYINKTGKTSDKDFLQHITDYRVLKRISNQMWVYRSDPWMTQTQKEILAQGSPDCSYETGTMSWGVPVGGDRMVCRCEQYDCPRFAICAQYGNFQRVNRKEDKNTAGSDLLDATSGLDNSATSNNPSGMDPEIEPGLPVEPVILPQPVGSDGPSQPEKPIEDDVSVQLEAPTIPDDANDPELPVEAVANGFTPIDQETIIHAPVRDRIWVNAGPGTGKTYTVIERIKHLLEQDIEGSILVLCFSRNAVQLIRERLIDAMGHPAAAHMEDGRLIIRTFDSFASYMLDDELNASWGYNQRIEKFINALKQNKGALDEQISYLIVDEIQDTVGVRARLLLGLLEELSCGALLLGDRCQAIFDWTIRDADDMPFSGLMDSLKRKGFRQYELLDNHRQNRELARMGASLRDAMLTDDEVQQEAAVNVFKKWIKSKWKPYGIKGLAQALGGGQELILCKTNGEAAHISQILFEQADHLTHSMKQSTNHRTLAAWIAKLLAGNDGHILTRTQFEKNALDHDIEDAEIKWNVLKSLDRHPHSPNLHIPELLSALQARDGIPAECINHHSGDVVVSTVHRAKGSEAKTVFWLDSPLVYEGQTSREGVLGDALKAAYVAATRARERIHMIAPDKNFYMKCLDNGRWINTGASKNGIYCRGIAMLPGDTDASSFVRKGQAEDIQVQLSCLEAGLDVKLYANANENCFDIYFDGSMIGQTSEELTRDLFAGFAATNHNKNWPSEISGVYIADIVTLIDPGAQGIDEAYRSAGCWLGVELGGFPKIQWT